MAPHRLISILLVSMVMVMPISSQQCTLVQELEPIMTKPGADLTIGLVIGLHGASQDMASGSPCDLNAESSYGAQNVQAARAASDNWPNSIQLPGLSVGLEIYDTCNSFRVAEFGTVRFADEKSHDTFETCRNPTLHLGIIGYSFSSWSEPLSTFLQPLDIPVTAFVSTSDSLSNVEEYPNFFRTIPPDSAAAKALVDIMKSYNWTYAAIVHSDDSYGISGLQAVMDAGLCRSQLVPISVGAGETRDEAYDAILNQLIEQNFTVVILWAQTSNLLRLFLAVERIKGVAYDITWLSSDSSLYVNYNSIPGNARAARNLIAASPFINTNATYKTWLAQYYPDTVFSDSANGYLIDAIHAYMAAFSLAHRDKCGGQTGMCEALANIQGSEFIDYMRMVNFTGIEGNTISFNENGDPTNQFYEVLNFKSDGVPNSYSLQKVGGWAADQGLTLNKDQVEFYGQGDTPIGPPVSVCTEATCCQDLSYFVLETLFAHHDYDCQPPLSPTRFRQLEAVYYAVHQINRDPQLLPDIGLSVMANDICRGVDTAGDAALTLIQDWNFDVGFPTQDNQYLLGTITSSSSSGAVAISRKLQAASIPVVDNTATSLALSEREEFGNFLRTVPSDVTQAEAIVDLLTSIDLKYVQTINTKGSYGDDAIKALKEAAKEANICIGNSFRVDSETDFAKLVGDLMAKPEARAVVVFLFTEHAQALFQELVSMNVSVGQFQFIGSEIWGTRMDYIPGFEGPAKGALTVAFKSARVPEFEDYLLLQSPETSKNPYFKEFWMQRFECNLPGETPKYNQTCAGSETLTGTDVDSLQMEYFINAVYVYALALSDLINNTCPDRKVCDALFDVARKDWLEHLKAIDFVSQVGLMERVNFDENGEGIGRYSVYQFDEMNGNFQYNEVGFWTSDEGLDLDTDMLIFYGPEGPTVGIPPSPNLLGFCDDPMCQDADPRTEFVIEGLFDSHGSQCDGLRENRFTQVEAARFAVHAINCNATFLPGVRLSLTMNDICGDTSAAKREALRSLQRWDFDGGFPNQDEESYLLGVLHSGSSGKAIAESQVLQIPDVPLLANSATSPALSDKSKFGNFLRTVPSDTKQAEAMADLLAGLDLTYIQTIHTNGAYGEGGILALKEIAKEKGICIANSFIVDSSTSYVGLLNDILTKPDARTLVLFLIDDHAQALFQAMRNKNVDPSQFQFLASDSWGTRIDYIPGFEDLAVGALTVFLKTSVIPEFENYFLQLTPETQDGTNPYFNEYWMQTFGCDLPGGDGSLGKNCTGLERLSSSDVNSLGMENIINVIHAYALGLSNLIDETCPDGGPCDALYDVTSLNWFDHLKDVAFVSPVGSKKMVSFDENGDGAAVYSIYQLQEMSQYQEIGSWDDVDGLSSLSDDIIGAMFSSECTGLCLECNPPPPPDTNITSHQDYFRIPGDLDFPVVMQLSKSGDGVACGDPKLEESLALESLLYALDKVNADPSVLPGVKLGVTVVDSCESPVIATRNLVGLLGDFVSLESTGKPFAVLGPADSDVAEEIADFVTGASELPMISFGALSPNLNEEPLVLATSAPYTEEVAAMIEVLLEMDWKYVGVVYSMTPYGIANFETFQTAAQGAGVCLGAQRYIKDDDNTTVFQDILTDFSSDDSLNVIVAFVSEEDARRLLHADNFQLSKRFVWVGTETWDSATLVSGLEDSAKGMLVVAKDEPHLPEILDYFSNTDHLQAASVRNPYLRDYLQEICPTTSSNCQFGNQIQESLRELSGEISPLVNALYVAARGANVLHDSKCGSSNDDLCDGFLDSSPEEKVDAIRQVTLKAGAGGNPFSFEGQRGPASYSIKNYQYDGDNGQFLIVGKWQNGTLIDLRSEGIELYNPAAEKAQRPPSGCSCGEGDDLVQMRVHVWKWIDYGIWSTVVLAVSGLCGVLAFLIGIFFLNKRNSYIVQSASFSLSMWLLFGIILMYLLNVAFMFEPNPAICGIRRFGVSFVYCVVYAAMFAKSIRANRFSRKEPGVDMNFAGSWSQSLLFLAFLLPEAFLVVEWLVLIPPDISGPLNACGTISMPTCGITNIDLIIFMMYAYFLVLITFLSSFGALNSSHAYHEGKCILVCSLFSILILAVWACILNFFDPDFGDPAIPIGLTADASIILLFMFFGKVGGLTKKENFDSSTKRVDDVEMENNILYNTHDSKKGLSLGTEVTLYENDGSRKDQAVSENAYENAGASSSGEAAADMAQEDEDLGEDLDEDFIGDFGEEDQTHF